MDRLNKIIKIIIDEYSRTCGEREECEGCKYYNGDCNLDYLIEMLFKWDKEIKKEQSIVLKNIDLNNATLDELFDKVIEKNEKCKYALTNLIELIKCNVNKEYLKEHYIEKILDQLQANINIASAYGITANDIMKYYNTKYLEKLKK